MHTNRDSVRNAVLKEMKILPSVGVMTSNINYTKNTRGDFNRGIHCIYIIPQTFDMAWGPDCCYTPCNHYIISFLGMHARKMGQN